MNAKKSMGCVLSCLALLAACSGSADYCADRQTAVNILSNKFAPCLDGGFADAGYSESACEDVLTGGNCSDGDRTALATIGNAGIACANQNPTCSPETPLDTLALTLQYDDCLSDAGIPASSVSSTCDAALIGIGAGY